MDIKCARGTGWFHTEKIGSRWWLCTPLGNAFQSIGVEGVIANIDGTFQNAVTSKYGSTIAWSSAANSRLLSWGFNTLSLGSYLCNLPVCTDPSFPLDSMGIHSQPTKMPFIVNVRPAYYAMHNPVITTTPFLTNPVKNMIYVHSPYYTGYVASGGVADYYDSGIGTWLQDDLQSGTDAQWNIINASPYKSYMIGIASDDSDETNGFGAGPDFPSVPAGHNNYNLGMQVAAMSPVETANPNLGFVYGDTLIHSKKALRDFLASKYRTIAALNAAWGSNYTTFDSSGTQIIGELIGTGNASELNFSQKLAHPLASKFSLQVFVNRTPVAGAVEGGNLWGPNVTGSIDEKTGLIMIIFKPGYAPPTNARITMNYVQDGWGIGTGLLDEDDRPSHQSWMGSDWVGMSNANANAVADINTFFQQIAGQYFSTCRTQFKAAYPNTLFLGPDALSTYGLPSAAPVLKAAGQYLDAFITGGPNVFSQAMMDFIEANFGDKPYFGSYYSIANPDSALSAYPNIDNQGAFNSQAARGQAYYNMMAAQVQTARTTAGNYPYIGATWFEYADNWGEQLNWGLVTHLDNAYDGHEAVTATVSCSAPLAPHKCGGEKANYGNLISWVIAANNLWYGYAKAPDKADQPH